MNKPKTYMAIIKRLILSLFWCSNLQGTFSSLEAKFPTSAKKMGKVIENINLGKGVADLLKIQGLLVTK
jgi:hypothetical protein